MSSARLVESIITQIEASIKSGIASALSDVRADRADAKVSTEVPRKYFRYTQPKAYEAPCVFIICDGIDLMNEARGGNYIAARARVLVSVLIEDRDKESLVLKSWRYQSALHRILHLSALTTLDSKVKLNIKVSRINFSPEFSGLKDESAREAVFRKEVALELDVEHTENL